MKKEKAKKKRENGVSEKERPGSLPLSPKSRNKNKNKNKRAEMKIKRGNGALRNRKFVLSRTRENGRKEERGQKVNCARTYQFIGKCARRKRRLFRDREAAVNKFRDRATVRIIDSSGEARWFSLPLSPLFYLSLSHFLASSRCIHGIGKELSSLVTNFAKPRNRDSSRNAAARRCTRRESLQFHIALPSEIRYVLGERERHLVIRTKIGLEGRMGGRESVPVEMNVNCNFSGDPSHASTSSSLYSRIR